MKNKILNVAGMSTPDSISFFGDNGDCLVDTVDFKSPPRYTKIKPYTLIKKVKNIPIIRGYAIIIDMIINLIKVLFKYKLWLVVIGVVLFTLFFRPETVVEIKEVKETPLSSLIPHQFWDYWMNIALYLIILVYIFLATKNHAAEHKAISAYELKQDLSITNIKSQPKENRRCGTVLVVWFLIISIPLFFFNFNIPGWLNNILQLTAFSFSYEIFLLARRDDAIGKIVYSAGWLGQKLTTREPNTKLLERSRQGIMKLLDEEGYRYRK